MLGCQMWLIVCLRQHIDNRSPRHMESKGNSDMEQSTEVPRLSSHLEGFCKARDRVLGLLKTSHITSAFIARDHFRSSLAELIHLSCVSGDHSSPCSRSRPCSRRNSSDPTEFQSISGQGLAGEIKLSGSPGGRLCSSSSSSSVTSKQLLLPGLMMVASNCRVTTRFLATMCSHLDRIRRVVLQSANA